MAYEKRAIKCETWKEWPEHLAGRHMPRAPGLQLNWINDIKNCAQQIYVRTNYGTNCTPRRLRKKYCIRTYNYVARHKWALLGANSRTSKIMTVLHFSKIFPEKSGFKHFKRCKDETWQHVSCSLFLPLLFCDKYKKTTTTTNCVSLKYYETVLTKASSLLFVNILLSYVLSAHC